MLSEPTGQTTSQSEIESLRPPIDRTDQLEAFSSVIRKIQNGRPVSSSLFEWHGPPGIGKTFLTHMLADRCRKLHVPFALIDFKDIDHKRNPTISAGEVSNDPTRLIAAMVTQLHASVVRFHSQGSLVAQAATRMHAVQDAIANYRNLPADQAPPPDAVRSYLALPKDKQLYDRPEWVEAFRTVVAQFVQMVSAIARASPPHEEGLNPVAFFFDETDAPDVSVELVDFIEEWVIYPLSQMKPCMVVWTSRRPWRWKRPEIRRRLQGERLEVFDLYNLKDQFKKSGAQSELLTESFFTKVLAVTGGHPAASYLVAQEWHKHHDPVQDTLSEKDERLMLERIMQDFVKGYVLEKVSREERWAYKLMSMVRFFDAKLLRLTFEVEASAVPELHEFANIEAVDRIMQDLKRRQLLVWSRGYAIDPTLRHLVWQYYEQCDSEVFKRVNQVAAIYYADWLRPGRQPDNRVTYVVEELYHQICLSDKANRRAHGFACLQTRLNDFDIWFSEDHEARLQALERLENELSRDEEMAGLTEQDSRDVWSRLVREHKFSPLQTVH